MSKLISLLQSKWIAAALGAVVFAGVSAGLALRAIPKIKPPAPEAAAEKTPDAPAVSWVFHSTEIDQLLEELKKEKEAVEVRNQSLKELELRLKTERTELDEVMKNVKKMQAEFDRDVLRVKEEETGNLKKLAKTYTAMKPASAATILRELDDSALVRILMFMKEADTAAILESFARSGEADARRAAALSERLRLSMVSLAPPKSKT